MSEAVPDVDPMIAELIEHLTKHDIGVGGVDIDQLIVWIGLESLLDHKGNEIELDDPHVLGVQFVAPTEDDERWVATLSTPAIVSLGGLGSLVDELPQTEEAGWRIVNDDGAAIVEIGFLVEMKPAEGVEIVDDLVALYLDLVAGYAPTGLEFAGERLEHHGVLTPGFAELHLGQIDSEAYRFADAEHRFRAARAPFEAAGLDAQCLAADILAAYVIGAGGRVDEGISMFDEIMQLLPPDAEEVRDVRAHALALRGALYTLQGTYGEADSAFTEAREIGGVEGIDVMSDLIGARDPNRSSDIKRRLLGDAHLDAVADDLVAQADTAMVLSTQARRVGDFDEALTWLIEADTKLREAGDVSSRPSVLAELVVLHISMRNMDDARSALETLKSLPLPDDYPHDYHRQMVATVEGIYRRITDSGHSDYGDGAATGPDVGDVASYPLMAPIEALLSLDRNAGLEAQLAAVQQLHDYAVSIGDEVGQAAALAGMAQHRLETTLKNFRPDIMTQVELALSEAIAAIRIHDRVRHRLADLNDRSRYMSAILQAYEHALLIACDVRRDPALAAELLVRIKTTGIPNQAGETVAGMLRVVEPPHVTINGRSRLATEESDTISLERDHVEQQAGPGAWWWSTWLSSDFLFWATVAPDHEVNAGAIALDPAKMAEATETAFGSEGAASTLTEPISRVVGSMVNEKYFSHDSLQEPLRRLRSDLPVGGRAPGDEPRAVDGLLGVDGIDEPYLMMDLGQLLVPEPLKQALRAAHREQPIRLLYEPSPSLSWLPVGLLINASRDGYELFRLIERAEIQFGAPFIQTAPAERRSGGRGVLAVVDPELKLDEVHPLVDRASAVLACADLRERAGDRWLGEATVDRVLSALGDGDLYRTFLFAGHAHRGADDDPLDAGLAIEVDGTTRRLTARHLIEQSARLRCPEQVVLVGCSTAVDSTTDESERWGLTAAFLLGGAEVVVGAGWDLLACAATTAFVDWLLREMSVNDPVSALRTVQLAKLDQWRSALESNRTEFRTNDGNAAHPYLWGPFTVVQVGGKTGGGG